MLINYNNENIEELSKERKVVIDFYASWCGPCKMFAPVFESIASKHEDITFIEVNIDEHEDITRNYKVMSVPTIIVIENGKVTKSNVGFLPEDEFTEFIK